MGKIVDVNERQVGGDHYRKQAIQHWDFAARLPYLEGCATKYVVRHASKNGIEDLLKAKHYIDKILAVDYHHVDTGHALHLQDLLEGVKLLKEVLDQPWVGDTLRQRITEHVKGL